jgi:hypothetical protein
MLPNAPRVLSTHQCDVEFSHDLVGDFILDCEDILEVPVVALGPDVLTGCAVDECR